MNSLITNIDVENMEGSSKDMIERTTTKIVDVFADRSTEIV